MNNQSRFSKTFNQLCHMVALSKDGKTEAALDNLVLTLFGINENFTPSTAKEFVEAIDAYFNLTLDDQLLELCINRLVRAGKIYNHGGVFVIAPKILSGVKTRIHEASVIEDAVREEWFASFGKFNYPVLPEWYDQLWMCLRNYMARAFQRHGIETTLLLYPKYDISRNIESTYPHISRKLFLKPAVKFLLKKLRK